MKKEFINYLDSIGLSKTMTETIVNKYNILKNVYDVDFDDIFVSEAISNTGNREVFQLYCFTPKIIYRIYITALLASAYPIHNYLLVCSYNDYNFDLVKADANSKLTCSIKRLHVTDHMLLNASGINCNQLLLVSKKYLLTNLVNT